MKFERTYIPVFTGVEKIVSTIKELGVNSEYHIAPVRTGVPCLIVNGSICDINGDPFVNGPLQQKFAWFSNRISISKFIGIGRLYFRDEPLYKKTYESGLMQVLCTNSFHFIKKVEDIMLEIEDICIPNSTSITFDTRMQVATAMSKNAELKETDITIQSEKSLTNFREIDIIDFIIGNGKRGKKTIIKRLKSKYIEGPQNKDFLETFMVDPFEIFSGKIISSKTSESRDIYSNSNIKLIDFIDVESPHGPVNISLFHLNTNTNRNLLEAIEGNLINLYFYRAMKYQNKIIYPTTL